MSTPYPPSDQPGAHNPGDGYGAPGGPQPYPAPAAQGTDPVAILGLVFAFLFWPVGLVLSLIGLGRTGPGKRAGRGLAIAGTIVSVIAGIIGVVVVAAFVGVANEAATEVNSAVEQLDEDLAEIEADAAVADPAAADEVAAADEADEVAEAYEALAEGAPAEGAVAMGEPATADGSTFTVTSEDCGETTIGDEYLSVDAQGVFCLYAVTVQNGGDEPFFFDSSSVTGCIGDVEYSSDGEASIYVEDNEAFLEEINPGNTVEATVVFDVPAETLLERLELSAGFLAMDKAVVTLR